MGRSGVDVDAVVAVQGRRQARCCMVIGIGHNTAEMLVAAGAGWEKNDRQLDSFGPINGRMTDNWIYPA